MDPTKGQYSSPQLGRTLQRVNTQVHNLDGPNKGQYSSPQTWTDSKKGQDLNPESGRTQQIVKNHVHKVDRPRRVKILVHRVDGLHKDEKFLQVYKVDGRR